MRSPILCIQFDRAAYMRGECAHKVYYRQFATASVRDLVCRLIGSSRVVNSTDPHFNDIPLGHWDQLHAVICLEVGAAIAQANASTSGGVRSLSLADTVCVAKAAAGMLREEHGSNEQR